MITLGELLEIPSGIDSSTIINIRNQSGHTIASGHWFDDRILSFSDSEIVMFRYYATRDELTIKLDYNH